MKVTETPPHGALKLGRLLNIYISVRLNGFFSKNISYKPCSASFDKHSSSSE